MYSSTQYSNTAQHKKIEESEEQVITCTPKINIQLPNIKSLMKQKNKENKWRSALKKWSPVSVKSMSLNCLIPEKLMRQKKKEKKWRSALNEWSLVPVKPIF